ncbi:xanthine dehydrogenase family protein subunit M [Actinomadura soli]|uniref:Xanthine dehydrogenase family protein subunit M n=1 Tax=Actinomadura soli TaxID=2508997 RepID=A0A5C4JGB4_9ACTN|nr:FAD binding domain-containing protein [Actinomadura soli]TMR04328.1 xanthine dehydrogenase family protein subunit M [Actinomadura soli]
MTAEYRRPSTLPELLTDMAEPGAFALAGGTDLIPLRTAGAVSPTLLVDVKHVSELNGITTEAGTTRIGAATTLADLAEHHDRSLDAILDGARIVGAPQTRNRATLGGNLCRSSPAGDTLCGLLVLDAIAELHSLNGVRHVPVRDFFTGPGRNVATPSEVLVSIRLPTRHAGSAYHRFTYRRSMDLAIVGIAARLSIKNGTCVDATIAIGAAAPTPQSPPKLSSAPPATTKQSPTPANK